MKHNLITDVKKPRWFLKIVWENCLGMVGGMVQNSTKQNHYQHQQPICSSTFFFYINNNIRPTWTINTIINIRSMPNSMARNSGQNGGIWARAAVCGFLHNNRETNMAKSMASKKRSLPVDYTQLHCLNLLRS